MPYLVVRPAEIVKALQEGPLTWRLLYLALGYKPALVRHWSLWERCKWWWSGERQSDGFVAATRGTLAEMVKVGQIVLVGDDVDNGPWTLPDCCPACHGSGKRTTAHPYRDGLKVVT